MTIPYLPPIDTELIDESEVYTLVLDLDETLIHYECDDADGDYYLIRPGAIKFLKELALYYEIVIFTAAMPEVSQSALSNFAFNSNLVCFLVCGQNSRQFRREWFHDQVQTIPTAHHSDRGLCDVS